MLHMFRNFGNTKVARVFLTLLALSFVAWGVGDYLGNSIGASAVRVGKTDISVAQLDQTYRQMVSNLTQRLGRAPTAEELVENRIAESIVSDAVMRAIMRDSARGIGLVPAVSELQDEIAGNPAFHGGNGVFDPARYRAVLANAGRTPEQFEQEMTADLGVRLLGQLVHVHPASATALAPQAMLENAILTLEVASIQPRPAVTDTPDDAELKRHYELNQRLYEVPERRAFTVLEVSRRDVAAGISVPEERLRQEYEANKDTFALPEQRVVRHILLESEEKADAASAGIRTLADFARVADAVSTDPGNTGGKGGSLGAISRDSVVPEFGEAAFSLEPGTLSKPVKSAFGWHLIWVEKVEPARARGFAEVKESIREHLTEQETEDAINRIMEQVDEGVAGGDNLADLARKVGLKATSTPLSTIADARVPGEIAQAAFMTGEGETSAPLTLRDGGAAYVQVTKVEPARVPPLDEIRPRVVEDWRRLQRTLALQRDGEKVLTAVRERSTRSMGDAVIQSGVNGVNLSTLEVKDLQSAPEWLHRSLLDVFQLPEGGTLAQLLPAANGGAHVVRLAKRTTPALTPDALEQSAALYTNRLKADVELLVMSHLLRGASISCNQARLRQIFGRDVDCSL